MHARERFFAVMEGEPVDRVPIWLLFPYHKTAYYSDVRSEPSYAQVFCASLKYAITLNRRNLEVRLFSSEVEHFQEEMDENGEKVIRSGWEYRGKQIFSEARAGKDSTFVKKLLVTDDDVEFFCSLPIELDPSSINAQLNTYLPRYLHELKEFPLELGAMMLDLGEPIVSLYHASNLESYSIWSLTHSDLIVNFLDRLLEQKRIVYRYFLERDLADVYFMIGSELASPPIVGVKTFQKWILPYASELIDQIHKYGKKVIQHYHGDIRRILPFFLDMQADALHTIEAPPVGNCTFTEAFQTIGNRMVLIGNIQYDDFYSFTPEQMRDAVNSVLSECRGKRLILSPSAGPYEKAIPEQVAQNYLMFMQTAWEYPAW